MTLRDEDIAKLLETYKRRVAGALDALSLEDVRQLIREIEREISTGRVANDDRPRRQRAD